MTWVAIYLVMSFTYNFKKPLARNRTNASLIKYNQRVQATICLRGQEVGWAIGNIDFYAIDKIQNDNVTNGLLQGSMTGLILSITCINDLRGRIEFIQAQHCRWYLRPHDCRLKDLLKRPWLDSAVI